MPWENIIEAFDYYYDNDDNRLTVGQPVLKYSQKKNLYSISPTWQLNYRDWSKNTVDTDDIVNEQGYPVLIRGDRADKFFCIYDGAVLTYDCSFVK